MKNNIYFIDCQPVIPEQETSDSYTKNAWIAPNGDFYGMEGAYHEKSAMYISIFKLGADDKTLKKGTFFNQSWESWLIDQGWVCIKNLAWLGDTKPSTFRYNELTEKQKTVLFDYCIIGKK